MLKKTLIVIGIIVLVLSIYLFLYPVPFEPVSWHQLENPGLVEELAPNSNLNNATSILEGYPQPEAMAIGPDNHLYTGLKDGRIIRFEHGGLNIDEFVNTGGRPLGMKFNSKGDLIIADEYKGLISVNKSGKVKILADSVDGTKIKLADDLDITSDGVIWFSDATQRHQADEVILEFWELQPTGRLLKFDPDTRSTTIELDSLRFANGVALGPDDKYVLVSETVGMRIKKLWLKGSEKGKIEYFKESLPGYPDNITYNNGIFWVAFPSIRTGTLEPLYTKPMLRKIAYRVSSVFPPEMPPPYGMIVGYDTLGNVVYNLQDETGLYHDITSALQTGDTLYFGSYKMDKAGFYTLK
ncbi:SMP-30/gluconolactonase/LRE family protein [Mangrovivirga sp. M17]|uniref:SMP-30/gluconolactonase/LRE family protein n=1 Tax=Mangrovivirga halotolerans TaxID=2993936 RepID=A0ABT3RMD3_9BACT|nr:SMP-30/gluconolactonase/LRE family protein [Mangrovivirga halotolerans]MCX2742767.1 SMP-30/gluconolactonase/LRE family protein [Mangrovivirga halotolerans]